MSEAVSYKIIDNIGVISVNNPPVNALAQVVRAGLLKHVTAAQADNTEALIIACEGRTFIAGADITEFGKPPQGPGLPELLAAIENSTKPIIAAIHGTALGGGFEVALACHYRCAISSAKVGLPEVKLGLLPGAGGTQRVPRIAGVKVALDMITSGNPIAASKALALGLIDSVVEENELEAGAINYGKHLVSSGAPLKRIRDISIDPSTVEAGFFDAAREQLAKRARGQIAADRIVSCIQAAVDLPMDAGLERERELFTELVTSPESAAMRHIFFAERQASKIKNLSKGTPVRAIIKKNYSITMKKGKLTEAQMEQCMSLVSGSTDYGDIANADMVIEAVFENLELKKEIFVKLDAICKPGAILASNTSYQDVDAIAAATSRPQDVLGMHFFSPANVMKLLEVVRGAETADDVLATAMLIGKKIGKVCALSGVCYGFIGNRMLGGYGREAQMLMMDGCTPAQVDNALEGFGMAMGPVAMSDLAGLDIGYKARENRDDVPDDPKPYGVADMLVEMGRLGQKTGGGFYKYDEKTRARISDPSVEEMIKTQAEKLNIQQREFSDQEILERCLYPLINEGALILEEGIAQRPSDIDVVYVFGYAFPAAKGGPMHYADRVGLKRVFDKICEFRDREGELYWKPAPLLEKLAKEGKTFAEWGAEQEA